MEELNMVVSPICKDTAGKKMAYVTFEDKERYCEGNIPACVVTTNRGFTEAEVAILEKYMRDHLDELKALAANNNIVNAIMK